MPALPKKARKADLPLPATIGRGQHASAACYLRPFGAFVEAPQPDLLL